MMGRKTILFIEDEPDQILLIQARLEANGFDVVFAMDGEDGLQKAHEDRPALVLLDLVMPKGNGFEVCKRLKQDPETKGIPVVLITAFGGRNLEGRCRAVGADGLLRKPYESADLVAMVKTLTQG
jgi:CheY-like chemotaxis protein